jgi:hypothetical protein
MHKVSLFACLAAAAALGVSNAALAQSCPANVPNVTGEWTTLPYQMPINPISTSLMHTGQILIVSGSENDPSNNSTGSESYRFAVWDPKGVTESSIAVRNINYDVFCSGTAALPDGRSLVVGGTSNYTFDGDNRASIFDPATNRLLQSPSMADGRWYATATALGDGRVLASSGLGLWGTTNTAVEIYDPAKGGWIGPFADPFTPPLYPRAFLLPSGRVFFTGQGVTGGVGPTNNSWLFDPVGLTWVSSAPISSNRTAGSAVLLPLLPPSYAASVMNFGGNTGDQTTQGLASTEIINLSAASPAWTPGPNMSTGRTLMNATILPNGKVLASGGSASYETPDAAGKNADLYDPVSNSFSSAGTASYSRLYHSTTLLLPDATVISVGSNPGSRGSYEAAIEIYTPPYLFDSNNLPITQRPTITGITPGVMGYNTPFSVTYTSASPISSAVLMRPGSATHDSDMEQRLVGLCGPSPQPSCSGSGTLNLTSPPNGNIAPPGYYMLFLLDSAGVPSVAQFIQLTPHTTTPPTGTIISPATDTTITAGGSVNFGTTTAAASYAWVFPGGTPATSVAQNPGNVTFTTAGEYVTSLTVSDASGNSDPSPPTRTITVLPTTPDFNISVSPSAITVIPGQSAPFTVTVTGLSGYGNTVSFSVGSASGLLSGVTSGGFSPSTITGSGSSTLTMNTTSLAVPYALSLTITGTDGTHTHTASTTLLINVVAPGNLTAFPGPEKDQIHLYWSASVGASSYQVQRSLVSGGPYLTVACPTALSYVDTGLVSGQDYFYTVSAAYTGDTTEGGGESASSPEASAVAPAASSCGLLGMEAVLMAAVARGVRKGMRGWRSRHGRSGETEAPRPLRN